MNCSDCNQKISFTKSFINEGKCEDCWNRTEPVKSSAPVVQSYELIPVITLPSFPSYEIQDVFGIVCGEVVMGANLFKDVAADWRNVFGGRSAAYENELLEGRQIAIGKMRRAADKLGANCILGCTLDYEIVGSGLLMIVATGTAVTAMQERSE